MRIRVGGDGATGAPQWDDASRLRASKRRNLVPDRLIQRVGISMNEITKKRRENSELERKGSSDV